MKQYSHVFGVDVSKRTIDITHAKDLEFDHREFLNNEDGMEQLTTWLNKSDIDVQASLFCMEATGLYCFPLTRFLTSSNIDIWIEHPLQIKKATGIARGKNDKVDSRRIAEYAIRHKDQVRLWRPMSATLEKIRHLSVLRDRLVETKKRLETPINEFKEVGDVAMAKLLTKSIKNSLASVDKDLKNIEGTIVEIVNSDDDLKSIYKLITSVVGIGFVTAVNLMIHTHGFTMLKDVRKLACYCGVAPFEYSSGTSVRWKTKVHYMANKKLKCNLHMASLVAIKLDPGLKAYYERKVAAGKSKMSVINAVRNKLLARIVAVVNKSQEYVIKAA